MRSRYNRRQDMKTRFIRAKRRGMVNATHGIHSCVFVLDGLKPDFNVGKIFRSAEAFGIRELHLVGIEYFDPDPAKGSLRWVKFHQHEDFSSCYEVLRQEGFDIFMLSPNAEKQLGPVIFPEKSAFIMGHEQFGVSFTHEEYPDIHPLSIPQWGKVDSLNVSIAASIVMYEYARQHTLHVPAQG